MSILTGATSLTPRMATAAAPVFIDAGTVAWTTGDILSAGDFSFSDYITDTSPEGFTVYELHSSSEDLPTTLSVNSTTGDITGTIDAIQGGTYNLVAEVTNLKGTTIITLQAILVGLEITAPVWATAGDAMPDLGNIEQGALVTVECTSYITDDGNPAGTEALTFSIHASSDRLIGDYIDPVTGRYSFTVDAGQTIDATTNVVIDAANSVTSSQDNFNIPIVASGGVVPQAAGLYSGNAGCSVAVIPTWVAGADEFFRAKSDTGSTWSLDLNDFIASNGGADITAWAEVTPNLPTGITLNTSTGVVSGSHDGTVQSLDSTFTATNSAGTSASSPIYTWTVWDDTTEVPVLLSISAAEGTNDVYVNFSELVHTTAGDAASYKVGFAFTVNGASRDATYASGGSTGRLAFTLDGAVFSGNNTIGLVYTTTSSDLKSVSANVHVATTTPSDFVVPLPGSGDSVIDEDFESYVVGVKPTGWGVNTTVTEEESYSGSKSARLFAEEFSTNTFAFGGVINIADLTGGDEVWVRIRTKWPLGADYWADDRLKFLRIKTEKEDGTHLGYNDWYINKPGSNPPFRFIYEGRQLWVPFGDASHQIVLGDWETYEMYIKLDSVSVDDGGTARVRLWKNGVLMKDATNTKTLVSYTDKATHLYVFTYWNNNTSGETLAPRSDQVCYVDDVKISSSNPGDTDSSGNSMIGVN